MLNKAIVDALTVIRAFPSISGTGDGFDNTCVKKFQGTIQGLKGFLVEELSAGECKKIREFPLTSNPKPALKPYLEKIAKRDYNFSTLTALPAGEVYLLRQPCGSQNWPDLVILNGNTGLPVEFKSSKDSNKIVWNSNMPRSGIYIFNGKSPEPSKGHTTFFLAADVINSSEVAEMTDCRKDAEVLASNTNGKLRGMGSEWSVYLRPMHNWGDLLLDSPNRADREKNVIDLATTYFPP